MGALRFSKETVGIFILVASSRGKKIKRRNNRQLLCFVLVSLGMRTNSGFPMRTFTIFRGFLEIFKTGGPLYFGSAFERKTFSEGQFINCVTRD